MKFNIHFATNQTCQLVEPGKTNGAFLGSTEEYKKCLPFLIAGELGWDVILPYDYIINWNGGSSPEDIKITSEDTSEVLTSTGFGAGILTLRIPYFFELENDTFLWIKGPTNNPLSLDLFPTEGLVEADWFPGLISIDYKILVKNKDIVLKKNSAYCKLVPYPKNYIEKFQPKYLTLKENKPFLARQAIYQQVNRMFPWMKNFLTCYFNGILGDKKVENFVPKIKLSKPTRNEKKESKCPFHRLLKL